MGGAVGVEVVPFLAFDFSVSISDFIVSRFIYLANNVNPKEPIG